MHRWCLYAYCGMADPCSRPNKIAGHAAAEGMASMLICALVRWCDANCIGVQDTDGSLLNWGEFSVYIRQ